MHVVVIQLQPGGLMSENGETDEDDERVLEARLRASSPDGVLHPLKTGVEVVDYDPIWPVLFARESERIHRVLGGAVRRLDHAGSTSVPGLAAKPCIDIILALASSADEPSYVPAMEAAGYVLRIREPEWFEHRVFKGPDTNINLHVYTEGCEEIGRMLAFRDWLRTHEDDRALYERTKKELAQREWKYMQAYADAKTEVVKEILGRALA